MQSRYDPYWLSRIEDIKRLLNEAYTRGSRTELDISDIQTHGQRDSWHGIVKVYKNNSIKGEMAHVRSLGKVILSNKLLDFYECSGFRMVISRNLKLMAERLDKDKPGEPPQPTELQLDFQFIKDIKLKDLLVRDWQEAEKAFKNNLYKSTVVLCGAIFEALLIDALSSIKDKAKSSYYQKYLRRSPEIRYWRMYELIEIARQHGIVSKDADRLIEFVREYRNLIHLYDQIEKGLQINIATATAVIDFLKIAYNNFLEWREKGGT